MTYEEIKPGPGWFRAREVGKTKNPNGTWSRITTGETYYKTKIGELREDEWERIAEETAREYGDLPLLQAIEDYVRKHCAWLKEKEIRGYSLHCLVDEAYRTWEERGEFHFTGKEVETGGTAKEADEASEL